MWIFNKGKSEMSLDEVTKLLSTLRLPTALTFTPINLENEKERFFESDTYNPQFEYKVRGNNNIEVFKKLKSLKSISGVDKRVSDFYLKLIEDKMVVDSLMKSTGNNPLFTEVNKSYYKFPTEKQFKNATIVLKGNLKKYSLVQNPKDDRVLKFDEIRNALNTTFQVLGLTDWKVTQSINIPKNGMKTGVKGMEILIGPDIERSPLLLKKSIIHEIGTHVLRSHNGLNCGVPALFKSNISEYWDAEEGLALYNEEIMGVLTPEYLKHRALMLYAIYIGENLSFRNLFNVLRGFTKPKEAFDITYRVKRGLSDTSQPGIYAKDATYFRGFRKVRKAVTDDPTIYSKLYSGKISLKMVSWVDDGIINTPTIVPNKEMFDSIFQKIGL
jgi:hypothetical protein